MAFTSPISIPSLVSEEVPRVIYDMHRAMLYRLWKSVFIELKALLGIETGQDAVQYANHARPRW